MNDPLTLIAMPVAEGDEQPEILPGMLAAVVIEIGGVRFRVCGAGNADSNLSRRDNGEKAKLVHVLQLDIQPDVADGETGAEVVTSMAFLCTLCGGVWWKKGQVTNHLSMNHRDRSDADAPEADATAATASSRVYVTRDLKSLTLGELLAMAKNAQGVEAELERLRERVIEEKRRRREAESTLATIQKAFAGVMGK